MDCDTFGPRNGRRSGPNPNGLSIVEKRWSGPGRIRKTKTDVMGNQIAASRMRPVPGWAVAPTGREDEPQREDQATDGGDEHREPAGKGGRRGSGRSVGRRRGGDRGAKTPERVAVADQHHHPPDRIPRAADDEQRPDDGERHAEKLHADERRRPEPERAGQERRRIDDAEDRTRPRPRPARSPIRRSRTAERGVESPRAGPKCQGDPRRPGVGHRRIILRPRHWNVTRLPGE